MTTKTQFEESQKLWFDPPNGHAYGFPAVFPDSLDPNYDNHVAHFLTCFNYPQKDFGFALKHSRWFGNIDRLKK